MLSVLTTLLLTWVAGAEVEVGFNLNLKFQTPSVRLNDRDAVQILTSRLPPLERVKLFDYDTSLIRELRDSGKLKHIVVGIPNLELEDVRSRPNYAANIVNGLRGLVEDGVHVTIAVGNEPTLERFNDEFMPKLSGALDAVKAALDDNGWNNVKLTVPFDAGVLGNSYPPKDGVFAARVKPTVVEVAQKLSRWGSPFYINLYPYFAYVANFNSQYPIALEYALLQTSHTVDGMVYPNMLAAQVAAVRAALIDGDSSLTENRLPIVVGETGWPTAGDEHSNPQNAQTYVNNAIASNIPLYIFEAFDERLKSEGSGSGSGLSDQPEGHYGWLDEQGNEKYPIIWPTPVPVPVPCDNKYPRDGGEFKPLDCPYGRLNAWLHNGDCVHDPSCDVIECPKKTKYEVLQYCTVLNS